MAKRLAIIASGIYSPLSSAVEFANRARSGGFEIKIFAPASATELLSLNGLPHQRIPRLKIHTLTPLLPPLDSPNPDDQVLRDRLDAAVSALGVDDLAQMLQAFEPDAIFVDCEMHAHIIVSLSLNVPVVQYSSMFLSRPGLRAPPLHKRSYPGQGLRGSRPAVLFAWLHHLIRKHTRVLRNRKRDQGADHPTALTELAHRHGVPIEALRRMVCWQMPWTYKIPTVLFLPQALDLPTQPYPEMAYLGPMILKNRPEKDYDRSKIARFCVSEGHRKRIFIGFGSMMAPDDHLVLSLLDIARRHPEWQILFAAGKHCEDATLKSAPPNVDVVTWVPQTEVLKHADLAIMHGGTGGLVEAVDAATPMLLFPHVNDQKGSAARVIFHGIGRAGRTTDPADRIEANMIALLHDTVVAQASTAMQAACRKETEDRVLESYLRQLTER